MKSGLCSYEGIGKFIFGTEDPNDHTLLTQTSFWTASVALNHTGNAESAPSLWDDPQGNPSPPAEDNTSPWLSPRDDNPLNPIPSGILAYTSSIQYHVRKTGYYCVGE